MLIGVPKEIKNHEYRVGLTPNSVKALVAQGHEVLVEATAGQAIGMNDWAYQCAGAKVVATAKDVFSSAEMIVKVKEPQPNECQMLSHDQILFAYLHLAPDQQQTNLLLESNAACIAYETVMDCHGGLPLLAPMSEVAGRLATQVGAHCLQKVQGGNGVLLGGVPGVEPAKVVILGGGVVGNNAAYIAVGMGAEVIIIDKSIVRLRELDQQYQGRVKCMYATAEVIEQYALAADLVIGAVLLPGNKAPKLLSVELIKKMRDGSVVVDVAIDQGGCFATSRPTTHDEPTFMVGGVVHYCVANIPGAVARTSTMALNNATLPFVFAIADKGYKTALIEDSGLCEGLNICQGHVTNQAVANAHGYGFIEPLDILKVA